MSDRGRWLVAGAVSASVSNNDGHRSSLTALPPRWDVQAAPSGIYFLRNRVGLGGYAGYAYMSDPYSDIIVKMHGLTVGVQAGFELALAPRLGWMFFPSAGYLRRFITVDDNASVYFSSTSEGARTQQRSSLNARISGHHDILQFGLFAPLVFHVSESLGFGLGPELAVDWYLNMHDRDTDERLVHVRLRVGTWIGASF